MAYSFQKVYTLIAQTPLIHFQHNQTGATLRATEVKPKLDRYLLKCAKEEGIDEELLDLWSEVVSNNENKSHRTFHYKMRIEKKEAPQDSQITLDDCKFYFGNQGDGDKKYLVFNNCDLQITCFITSLMEFIDRHIGAFFVLHNFGTRQTKGFGGFRIEGQTKANIETAVKNSGCLYFYADMPAADQNSVKNRFNHALTVYSVMKNGLNMTRYNGEGYDYPDRYIKGYAMRPYFDDLGKKTMGSDKAFIKSNIFTSQYDELEDFDYAEFSFIRAIFGLAEQYEFRDDMRNNGRDIGGRAYNPVGVSLINCSVNKNGSPNLAWNRNETNMKKMIDDLKKSSEIQRFASPVTIKIYQDRIYFLFNDSYKDILGQTFLFLAYNKNSVLNRFGKKETTITYETISNCLNNGHYLSTPKTFDMKNFLNHFISYYNGMRINDPNSAKGKLKLFGYPYKNSQTLTLRKGW